MPPHLRLLPWVVTALCHGALGCGEGPVMMAGSGGNAGMGEVGGSTGAGGTGGPGGGGSGASAGVGGVGGGLTPPPPDNPTDARRLDLRDFDVFRIAQTPGLGNCEEADRVASAELVRTGEDTFLLNFVEFVPGPDFDACIDGKANTIDCYVPSEGEPRVFTDFDLAQLEGAFASLTVHFAPEPTCENLGSDVCRIITLRWDDFGVGDFFCEPPWISGVFADLILQLVTDFALNPREDG